MKQFFFTLALLCALVKGAWAQADWAAVYAMTQTNASSWTTLTEGSTTGQTLGSAGTMTYCYAGGDLLFSNNTAGGSGLTIQGFKLHFGHDGVTTGIIDGSHQTAARQTDAWYSLDGRRLSGKQHKKGIYFRNGKKIVIK